jgi:hypothetical protein
MNFFIMFSLVKIALVPMIGRFSEEQALFVAEFKALICYGGFDIGGGVAAPVVFAMVPDTRAGSMPAG